MKPRTPPCCVICSPPESRKKYEATGRAGRLFPGKKGIDEHLVLTKPISYFPDDFPDANEGQIKRAGQPLEFICTKCAWSRPNPEAEVDGFTKMWFQSCGKCGERHITTELHKCAICDLGLL